MKYFSKTLMQWHRTRSGAAIVAIVSLLAAYTLVSVAIDSGTIAEYLAAVGLIGLAVNRLAHVVRVSSGKTTNGAK